MSASAGRVALLLLATPLAAAWLRAGGGDVHVYPTVTSTTPASLTEYASGQLGVVRPSFARRHLAQAYRIFSGQAALANLSMPSLPRPPDTPPYIAWLTARDRALGQKTDPQRGLPWLPTYRRLDGQYQEFENCLGDALRHAARTLDERVQRYGPGSVAVRDWVGAQDVVFSNCAGTDVRLPALAPAAADSLARADRDYQRAAAYFYATRYDEARRAFTAIAGDRTSPWQPYGQYLSARTLIREALVLDTPTIRSQRLEAAERELRAVLEDASATARHESARDLLDYIAARLRPVERLHTLSTLISRAASVSDQQVTDYRKLLDGFVGDTVVYDYDAVRERDALIAGDDLIDWTLAMQGTGEAALARSLERWRDTRSTAWLVAALWKLPALSSGSQALLAAAAAVDRRSPAFATVAFLRVRLLTEAGRLDDARALLASLPDRSAPGFDTEAVNLYRAQRLRVARTPGEFLASATRTIVTPWTDYILRPGGQTEAVLRPAALRPVFDNDVSDILTTRMPLARLLEVARSPSLPGRLRVRVAMATFTRATRLRRDNVAREIAPVLRELAPALHADLDRYLRATNEGQRHSAAVKLLLWTPGAVAHVQGLEDDRTIDLLEPTRTFQNFRVHWWCRGYEPPGINSPAVSLLYGEKPPPYPAFLTAVERQQAEDEQRELAATADASTYLLAETLAWVKARPQNTDAPEALARAIRGVREGCNNGDTPKLAREAFSLLHSRYAGTAWARQTKYWYADR